MTDFSDLFDFISQHAHDLQTRFGLFSQQALLECLLTQCLQDNHMIDDDLPGFFTNAWLFMLNRHAFQRTSGALHCLLQWQNNGKTAFWQQYQNLCQTPSFDWQQAERTWPSLKLSQLLAASPYTHSNIDRQLAATFEQATLSQANQWQVLEALPLLRHHLQLLAQKPPTFIAATSGTCNDPLEDYGHNPQVTRALRHRHARSSVEAQAWQPAKQHLRQTACPALTQVPLQPKETTLGVSALVQFNRCPTRYFATFRLNLRQNDELQLISPLLGIIMHECLANSEQTIEKVVNSCLKRHAPAYLKSLSQRLQEEVEKRLQHWQALESNRSCYTTVAKEYAVRYQAFGITLNGRIDRVDRLTSGDLIIDYKTAVVRLDWYESLSQLPIYALLWGRQSAALAFAFLLEESSHLTGHIKGDGEHDPLLNWQASARYYPNREDSWETQYRTWQQQLDHSLRDFATGNIQANPSPQECATCPYQSLCRYHENHC